MGYISMPARRPGGRRRIRGLWLAALTILGVMAVPVAAAQADATWTGLGTTTLWGNATNWTGTAPAANSSAGALTFPDLGACTGTACYTSNDDLGNVSSTGLTFSNTTAGSKYSIIGNPLTLTGGITDTSGGGTGAVINAPLVLSGGVAHTFAIGSSGGYNSLSLLGGVTGTNADTLTVTLPSTPHGDLFVNSDMEVGNVTVNGAGGLHIGGAPGTNTPGSVNATNGQAVTLNGPTLVANPGAKVGPLTMNGGTLVLGTGTNNATPSTLQVNGGVTIAATPPTTTKTLINDNGSTAGTDFSQLSATGNVALNGNLSVSQGPGSGGCAALTNGDVATLITTTGTLTGTFANAAQGATIPMTTNGCSGPAPSVMINYTTNSVTATVVGGTQPTSTSLSASPSPSNTNRKVTLTATVSAGGATPLGTVSFSANGTTIAGCGSQPVSSGTATCVTPFAAADSPVSLTATFTGATGSGQTTSTSSPQTLTINKGISSTKLNVSNTAPVAGGSVTYTATVTPGTPGPTKPSGAVRFLDGGKAISSCAAQPLTAGSTGSTATCTLSYPGAGSHSITAQYLGDANFTGSTSSATAVTVSVPPPPTTGRLLGPGGRLIVFGRSTLVTVKCQSNVPCRGSFVLATTVRKHQRLVTVLCASASFRIRAHHSEAFRVRLSAACLHLLRASRHHRLTVVYTSHSSTGQVGQRKRITLVLR